MVANNQELLALIGTLENEHVDVREALGRINLAIGANDPAALLDALLAGEAVLGSGLDAHSLSEDDDLFPPLADAMGDGLLGVFVEEHVRIRSLRDRIYAAKDRGQADFNGSEEFSQLLTDHIDREDAVLFPSARGVLAG